MEHARPSKMLIERVIYPNYHQELSSRILSLSYPQPGQHVAEECGIARRARGCVAAVEEPLQFDGDARNKLVPIVVAPVLSE